MKMSESNRKQFSEVVELMEREIAASSDGDGSEAAGSTPDDQCP
jgi:hypothetical protein